MRTDDKLPLPVWIMYFLAIIIGLAYLFPALAFFYFLFFKH